LTRSRISSIAALGLVAAALLSAPTAAAAKPATRVEPARQIAVLNTGGTDGWHLQITSFLESGRDSRQSIGIFTRGPRHQNVDYVGVKGRASEDGTIKWQVPGLGRVDVRFEQNSETPLHTIPQDGCAVEGRSAILKGVFRGTIEFHGEGGYTTVKRASGRGRILVSPREVCARKSHQRAPEKSGGQAAGVKDLDAGRDLPAS
jgi:hypothetical protein